MFISEMSTTSCALAEEIATYNEHANVPETQPRLSWSSRVQSKVSMAKTLFGL